jgi:hypothetical protein
VALASPGPRSPLLPPEPSTRPPEPLPFLPPLPRCPRASHPRKGMDTTGWSCVAFDLLAGPSCRLRPLPWWTTTTTMKIDEDDDDACVRAMERRPRCRSYASIAPIAASSSRQLIINPPLPAPGKIFPLAGVPSVAVAQHVGGQVTCWGTKPADSDRWVCLVNFSPFFFTSVCHHDGGDHWRRMVDGLVVLVGAEGADQFRCLYVVWRGGDG